MGKAYRIKDWNRTYECSDAKRTAPGRPLSWVAIPTKHDGKGFRRLWKLPDSPEVFSGFILMVQLAGKTPIRGLLADHDGAMDAETMSDKTGAPVTIFEKALKSLLGGNIGWIECVDLGGIPEYQKILSESAPTGQDDTGQDIPPASAGGAGSEGGNTANGKASSPRHRKAPTPGHSDLIEHFTASWREKYGTKYEFLPKDAKALNSVLRTTADLGRARQVVDRYLASTDPFLGRQRHPATLLLNQLNRFTSDGEAASSDDRYSPGFVPKKWAEGELESLIGEAGGAS